MGSTPEKKKDDMSLKNQLQDCTVDMETKLLKPASALSNIRKHIVTAAWAFDKREYHPYDMNNPDFIKTQKKLQYNDRMLKTL